VSVEQNTRLLLQAAERVRKDYCLENTIQITQTGPREIEFRVVPGDTPITQFSISYLPGCRHVVVFHKVSVEPMHRNQGYGKTFHKFRLAVAREFKAKTAICTMLKGNSIEQKILEGFGWKPSVVMSTPGVILWTKVIE